MKSLTILSVLLLLLVVASCSQAPPQELQDSEDVDEPTIDDVELPPQNEEEDAAAQTQLNEAETLESELDDSSFDNLEEDMDQINW